MSNAYTYNLSCTQLNFLIIIIIYFKWGVKLPYGKTGTQKTVVARCSGVPEEDVFWEQTAAAVLTATEGPLSWQQPRSQQEVSSAPSASWE